MERVLIIVLRAFLSLKVEFPNAFSSNRFQFIVEWIKTKVYH